MPRRCSTPARRARSPPQRGNLASPLLAEAVGGGAGTTGGAILLALIAAVAFATILAVVAGLTLTSASSVAHDLYANVVKKGEATEKDEVGSPGSRPSSIGGIAIVLSISAQTLNIAFLVALAFAVAASANLPSLLYNLFWKRFNTRGATWAIYGGLVTCVVLVVFSPVVSGSETALFTGSDWSWFPLANPGIVSIPVGFLFGWLGTVTSREPEAEARLHRARGPLPHRRGVERQPCSTDRTSAFTSGRPSSGRVVRTPSRAVGSRDGRRPDATDTRSHAMTDQTLSNLSREERRFEPPAELAENANVKEEAYERAASDREAFWAEQAERLDWGQKWDRVLDWDNPPFAKWFIGGTINAAYNCVDRHVEAGNGDKVAIHWVGEPEDDTRDLTYAELKDEVCQAANALTELGVEKGDRVAIYLPMIPETVVAMLACARIGAPHTVVFGGFSADALASRVADCEAKVIITADGGYRRGAPSALKPAVDEAVGKAKEQGQDVDKVLVVRRTGQDVDVGRLPRRVVARRRRQGRRPSTRPSCTTPSTRSTSCTRPARPASPRASCTRPAATSSARRTRTGRSSTSSPTPTSTGAPPTSAG